MHQRSRNSRVESWLANLFMDPSFVGAITYAISRQRLCRKCERRLRQMTMVSGQAVEHAVIDFGKLKCYVCV